MISTFFGKSFVLKGAPKQSGGLGKAVWRRCDLHMVMKKKISGDSAEERKGKTVLLPTVRHVQSPSELWIIPHSAVR